MGSGSTSAVPAKGQLEQLLSLVQGIDAKLTQLSREFGDFRQQCTAAPTGAPLNIHLPSVGDRPARGSIAPGSAVRPLKGGPRFSVAAAPSSPELTPVEQAPAARILGGLVSKQTRKEHLRSTFQRAAQQVVEAVRRDSNQDQSGLVHVPESAPSPPPQRSSFARPPSSETRDRLGEGSSPLRASIIETEDDERQHSEGLGFCAAHPSKVTFTNAEQATFSDPDYGDSGFVAPPTTARTFGGSGAIEGRGVSMRDAVEQGLACEMGEEELRLLTEVMNEASFYQESSARCMLIPDSPLRKLVDSTYAICTVMELLYVSWMITEKNWDAQPTALAIVALGIWCAMNVGFIVTNFRTAYLDHWELVGDDAAEVSEVTARYLRGWFTFDLLLALPVDLAVLPVNVQVFRVLNVARAVRFMRIPWLFAPSNPLSPTPQWIKVLLFLCVYISAIHLMSCLWLRIAHGEDRSASMDEVEDGADLSSEMTDEYIISLYFTVTVMTTVGFGDVTPKTRISRIFAIVAMVFGVSVYAFVMGNVGILLRNDDLFENQMKEKKLALNSVMRHYNIPLHVQKEAFCIYPAILERVIANSEETMQELPDFMQVKIYHYMKISLISKVALFRGANQEYLSALAMACSRQLIPPKTFLVEAGDVGMEMFIIVSGIVEVFQVEPEYRWLANLKDGSWFGELSLLQPGTKRTASVRALTACELLRLRKVDFDFTLERFPDVRRLIEKEASARIAAVGGQHRDSAGTTSSDLSSGCAASDGPEGSRNSYEQAPMALCGKRRTDEAGNEGSESIVTPSQEWAPSPHHASNPPPVRVDSGFSRTSFPNPADRDMSPGHRQRADNQGRVSATLENSVASSVISPVLGPLGATVGTVQSIYSPVAAQRKTSAISAGLGIFGSGHKLAPGRTGTIAMGGFRVSGSHRLSGVSERRGSGLQMPPGGVLPMLPLGSPRNSFKQQSTLGQSTHNPWATTSFHGSDRQQVYTVANDSPPTSPVASLSVQPPRELGGKPKRLSARRPQGMVKSSNALNRGQAVQSGFNVDQPLSPNLSAPGATLAASPARKSRRSSSVRTEDPIAAAGQAQKRQSLVSHGSQVWRQAQSTSVTMSPDGNDEDLLASTSTYAPTTGRAAPAAPRSSPALVVSEPPNEAPNGEIK
eukprot:TRINITY_DN55535_c0_g1_i1.p1 TRINITY_DN55535_c0_g1~~TRINITY_DN55535_c0_g1_i1.p1  ORF type:complete len:1226 (+),score=257.59 TRINITY_DN55535_c0_g1_i1:214-3678(+)